jgi:predicted phosphoribosyltransferase
VPVAAQIASAYGVPLDVLMVQKLGVPGHSELAMGAIASGGGRVLNHGVVERSGISRQKLAEAEREQEAELRRREQAYRGGRQPINYEGRHVVLVDDGLATGATMTVAVQAVRGGGASAVLVAVPVAPPDAVDRVSQEADEVIALSTPSAFMAVGRWYEQFQQTSDDEVRRVLKDTWS